MRNILLLVKGLGRGGAEQIVVSSARFGDRSRFRYQVAYLLPTKSAFVGELERDEIAVRCLKGGTGLALAGGLRNSSPTKV